MELKPLPIGIDDFEKLITRGYYFVDKTLLIKDLLDNKADVNLFTRPRRFGKTLNMSMLQYFFENTEKDNKDSNSSSVCLFEGLNIMNQGEKYTSHMGQYPVINLSLKSAKQPTFQMAYECIIDEISKEYARHIYVLDNKKLIDSEKENFLNILNKKGKDSDYAKSIQFLSICLEKYHGKKTIILIDEYDVPLENAFFEGFYDRMIAFIRSLFESALKTNSSLEFSVITGCLRISKESIFTGLNNLNIISILNDRYAEYFGFSDDEVKELTKYYKLEEKYSLIKDWYNGYIFGQTNVYNPWSVIKFIYDLLANINVFPSSYWANTSSNSIVRSLIEKADTVTKKEIELLIEGKTIEKPVHEDITYDEIYDTMDNLWNFMFFTGYFKKVNEKISETNQKYLTLEIPNEEVKYIFRRKVLRWFEDKIKVKDLSKLYTAIINREPEIFEVELGRLLMETISFNDYYENFYHGFVVGVLANMHDYIVKSNREGGTGRSDLFIKSVSKRGVAIVIEFKIAKDIDDLEKRAEDALKQIKEKGYDTELRSEGYKNIVKYGISFFEKDCYVKLGEE
ncbi:AAA family ATPase [Clostridium beijerinckii]|uniref:AAA family ATPase n=1 Tax=Clostridium beijerinckii TaxID=1520 RepID=UPI001361D761|nr:AAA family ATPase [Clostridium beijerinckii]MZK52082.1 AAA family ATPase [Clostridium beijerinckii]MZK60223.1 AAA family ATPase [Clostridium beijerinckii]MZK70508.1 AAA family ATPase [Clostridium beijerinckii]MZK75810.1 AAA family ATPase [Clostridium beijerinckii]MZK85474.1 AAA family ATPase [Clostridium beijerinckii]